MTPPAEGRPPGERPSPRTASQAPAEVAALLAEPGEWSFSRASGPGGQRRDHAETRAVLMVTATALEDLPERIAARLAAGPGLARRPLRLSSRAGRSRARNRLAVIARLERRVAAAPAPPPAPRRPPARAARPGSGDWPGRLAAPPSRRPAGAVG